MDSEIILNTGARMPVLGLGVYQMTQQDAELAVPAALRAGYRMIDTAPVYRNEEWIGKAVEKSSVPRSELFITSKIWNTAQRMGDIDGAFSRSLDRLRLDYVDLYLIHWPVPGCYLGTYKEMEKLLAAGKARAIGVCNFGIHQLDELRSISGIVPAVNQIEIHPLCYPRKLIDYCFSQGIAVQACAPLGRGAYLDNDIVCVLATKYAKTPAQIGLRWAVQKGFSVIPKSSRPERISLNSDLWSFELEPSEMLLLDGLNENLHTAGMPDDLKEILKWDESGLITP